MVSQVDMMPRLGVCERLKEWWECRRKPWAGHGGGISIRYSPNLEEGRPWDGVK